MVDQAFVGLDPGQPLAGEDRPGAVAEQPFQTGPVPRWYPHLGVEGKTAAVLPPEIERWVEALTETRRNHAPECWFSRVRSNLLTDLNALS
jgi:hypothetical protein